MQLNDYQEYMRKWYRDDLLEALPEYTMGLAGEVGEVVEPIKKMLYHDFSPPVSKIHDELGDVLAYLTLIATAFGHTLESIAAANLGKLEERYPDGFYKRGAFSTHEVGA